MIDLVLLRILPFAALGVLLAFAYLSALGFNVRLYRDQGSGWIAPLFHLARLLGVAATLTLCAREGALALLSSMAGFHMMRTAGISRRIQALE